jgi:pyrroline-5-carboxylate reductase
MSLEPASALLHLAFIGGGNMARAIVGGLHASLAPTLTSFAAPQGGSPALARPVLSLSKGPGGGRAASSIVVIEPAAELRDALVRDFGVIALAQPGPALRDAQVVVWAVKPQSFAKAAADAAAYVGGALQLSIMAGIRSDAIARAAGTRRVVRAMPNTPALIGQGIAGLYARPDVDAAGRAAAERVLATTGQLLWVEREEQLDAVTALSGSGPAYVFYLLEALIAAGEANGLSASQAKQLALGTLAGATELAARSNEAPAQLRERVTSKGGTTHAALEVLKARGVADAVIAAVTAANERARELGDESDAASG